MDIKEQALKKHYEWQGKIEVVSRAPIETREDLSLEVLLMNRTLLWLVHLMPLSSDLMYVQLQPLRIKLKAKE